ncbi:MAG: tRNA (adenosine(37)-N6)-threonylcarbamoyltransferase complex transferase subunit TsaD [Patescibacteria group bacterium]
MKILAIETSCDDTCVAILEEKNKENRFLSSVVSSQIEIHREWGGVYPTLAKREHQKNLVPVLEKSLKEANLLKKGNSYKNISKILEREEDLANNLKDFLKKYNKPDIDYLAVTIGPGLDPSLWAGINFAKALSFAWDVPVIPINHIKAHFFAPLVLKNGKLPAVSLLASGGHTQLIVSQDLSSHKVIGKTRDDAAGECFDKTARILGLDYPGGPEIAKLAEKDTNLEISLPRPMLKSDNYDFSFSGLKTAVLYRWRDEKDKSEDFKIAMAKEIQEAITDVLVEKTFKAVEEFKVKTVVVGGGVSANLTLRKKIKEKGKNLKVILPDLDFSTDNAKMIAVTALYEKNKSQTLDWKSLESNPNLKIN